MVQTQYIQGVTIGLRLEYIDEILKSKPDLPFLEIIADNWFSSGPHHAKLKKLREIYPISFHCVGLNLGGDSKIKEQYLSKIKKLKKEYKPFQISDHLCFQNSKTHYFHDLLPFPLNEDSLKNTIERVRYVQEILEEKILVENLSYYVKYKNSTLSEIDFINHLLNETGCYFLLDLNNIWVNQINQIDNCEQFLKKVQWSKVREIHLAGPEIIDNIYVDTHGAEVHNDVLDLVKRNKELLRNLPIVYERDHQIPPFNELINYLKTIREYL